MTVQFRRKTRLLLLGSIALLACGAPKPKAKPASVESEPAKRPIDDAAWLAGRWVGSGLGGQLEETWAAPIGGQMIGHFRMTRDGAPVFYELLLIEETDAGLRYRVKHFNPDFVGWEEKDSWHEFAPVGAAPSELRFDGLTLRRTGDDTSDHLLRQRGKDGVEREVVLRYKRAD